MAGDRAALNKLFGLLKKHLGSTGLEYKLDPVYVDFHAGDIVHSLANVDKTGPMLGLAPSNFFSIIV